MNDVIFILLQMSPELLDVLKVTEYPMSNYLKVINLATDLNKRITLVLNYRTKSLISTGNEEDSTPHAYSEEQALPILPIYQFFSVLNYNSALISSMFQYRLTN